MVGAGAVVTHSVPDYALVVGSPARFRAWICRCGEKLSPAAGRIMDCACGRCYEQTAENEVTEFGACRSDQNGSGNQMARDFGGSIIKNNGHLAANGR